MKKQILLLFALLCSVCSFGQNTPIAENVQVGAYVYDFYEDGTCVMKDVVEKLSGDVTFPSQVAYNDKNYTLTEITDFPNYMYNENVADITSLVIPEGVTRIDCHFNAYQHVKTITVPSTVTSLKYNAFCFGLSGGYQSPDFDYSTGINNTFYDLEKVIIKTDKLDFKDIDGVLFSKDGKTLLCCTRGRQGEYTIPDGVEVLADRAFNSCNKLTKINIPSSVKEIGPSPVNYNPENPEEWGWNHNTCNAFSWCNQIKEIELPDINYIAGNTFRNCWSLEKITIPNTVKFIGYQAFSLLAGLKAIDWNDCHLEGIDSYVLSCMMINATGVPQYTLELPMHVKYIGEYAFSSCLAPESINLSPDLEYLGKQFVAFYNEKDNATTTETLAPLKKIYNYRSEPLEVNEDIFGMDEVRNGKTVTYKFPQAWADECVLYVPIGTANAYKAHEVWGRFKNIEEFDASLPEEDGIKEVENNRGSSLHIYDMMGRAIKPDQMKHGLYIINGRKVMK